MTSYLYPSRSRSQLCSAVLPMFGSLDVPIDHTYSGTSREHMIAGQTHAVLGTVRQRCFGLCIEGMEFRPGAISRLTRLATAFCRSRKVCRVKPDVPQEAPYWSANHMRVPPWQWWDCWLRMSWTHCSKLLGFQSATLLPARCRFRHEPKCAARCLAQCAAETTARTGSIFSLMYD